MIKRIFGFFAVLFVIASCRPYAGGNFEPSTPSSGYDFSRIFDDFWNGMNRNYVYWDLEPTSLWDETLAGLPAETRAFILDHPASFWDMMYDYYKPKFDELGVFAADYAPGFAEAVQQALKNFALMTNGLVDGHFRVYFKSVDPTSPGEILHFPAQTRYLINTLNNNPAGANAVFSQSNLSDVTTVDSSQLDISPENLQNDLKNTYLAKYDFVTNILVDKYGMEKTGQFVEVYPGAGDIKIVAGEIPLGNGIIPYLFTNYCQLTNLYAIPGDAANAINAFFTLLEKANVKGVIVDVRGNMGGEPADNSFLFGRMIDRPLTFAYSRSKSGEGRLDYSPWMPVRIMPAPGTAKRLRNTNVPIVLLADRGTMSGAEFHTMIVKAMPNGTVIGEKTNGSASHTVDSLTYNGGAFILGPVVTQVAGSVVQYKAADGNIYEGFGIPPDIPVKMTRSDWEDFFGAAKRDKYLEMALKHIDPNMAVPPEEP
jgi:hypothetical protein